MAKSIIGIARISRSHSILLDMCALSTPYSYKAYLQLCFSQHVHPLPELSAEKQFNVLIHQIAATKAHVHKPFTNTNKQSFTDI